MWNGVMRIMEGEGQQLGSKKELDNVRPMIMKVEKEPEPR